MSLQSEDIILYYILAFILFENIFEIYLTLRQVKVYKNSTTVPAQLKDVMTQKTFDDARLYGLDKAQYAVFKAILTDIVIVSLELLYGVMAYIWHECITLTGYIGLDATNEIYISCVFMFVLSIVGVFKELPWTIYSTFVLEEKHGFNKQTAGFFIKDQIKSFVLSNVLALPIVSAIIYIVQIGGPYFYVWLWMFLGIITLLLVTIYPVFIAPLFDKYRPLDSGPLRESIEKLAASLKFPLTQLYVVEGSKRSAHSNAYFYGLWGSKRIVLFDTLLINKGKPIEEKKTDDEDATEEEQKLTKEEKAEDDGKGCEDSEVLAVLAHELGHWKLGHITKNIVIGQVHLFLMFAAFGYLFNYEPFYRAVGFNAGEKPILVGLILIFTYILAAYNAFITFAMTVLSRKFEYQADEFARKLGYTAELCKALIKLNIDNLGFPYYDWLYSSWSHSHPTLLQRIDRLNEKKTN